MNRGRAASQPPDWPRFRIGQASRLLGVDSSTLRYWEEVFPQLRPHRRRGQRLYRRSELDLLTRIKQLLYEEGYTIRGAREVLQQSAATPAAAPPPGAEESDRARKEELLDAARRELQSIVEQLRRPAGPEPRH
jgi:DNA-binding transcriptional MerR regulator